MALLGALGHLANLGQFVEIGQGHVHQKEQIHWTHRNYRLDVQALKIDLLGAARDDVRGTYDTYIERLDTLLLLNALLLPFAFNTLQFSDEFVPKTEDACNHECFEARNPWIADVWVYLVGGSLIMPFWSLLLLLWCKIKLDHWLQFTLGELQKLRREIITRPASAEAVAGENAYADHEEIVTCLGSFIVEYQDFFSDVWSSQCAPLVHNATRLLWSSAYVSVGLVGLMFWIFLVNRKGEQNGAHWHFAWVIVVGLVAPVIVLIYNKCVRRGRLMPEPQRSLVSPRRSSTVPSTGTSPCLVHSASTRSSLVSRARASDMGSHAEELLGSGRGHAHALEQD